MSLERAVVFRQLDAGARFARFGVEDLVLPIAGTVLTAIAAQLFTFHPLYDVAVFGALIAASWVLRTRLKDPPLDVLLFALSPRHFSQFAPDRLWRPYPGAPHEP